jgi:hypothetical protein
MHHKASFALCVAWYNFVRVNTAIRMTPCMAAGRNDLDDARPVNSVKDGSNEQEGDR